MDFEKIKAAAQAYQADMTRFLRDMISHPSESCEEREVVHCIKAEMEKLGYDKVEIDGLGNVIGWMGDGDKIIAIDSHIDTVGVGKYVAELPIEVRPTVWESIWGKFLMLLLLFGIVGAIFYTYNHRRPESTWQLRESSYQRSSRDPLPYHR